MSAAGDGLPGGLEVSRETYARLKAFDEILRKWNPRINLVSKSSLGRIWDRHIADSVQAYRCAPGGRAWVDLGSGGGFPGMVAAILAADEAPQMQVTLVESDRRKAAFLRNAARAAGVSVAILTERAEDIPPLRGDILSARALTGLSGLLDLAERHLRPGGTALFPKGVTWQKEVDAARRRWHFQVEPIKSQTEPGAAILRIKGVARV